jgi:hypothetical protein
VETLVPEPTGTTGRRFDPSDEGDVLAGLIWMTSLSDHERAAMGQRAGEIVLQWGPDRFAQGMLDALEVAMRHSHRSAHALALAAQQKMEVR